MFIITFFLSPPALHQSLGAETRRAGELAHGAGVGVRQLAFALPCLLLLATACERPGSTGVSPPKISSPPPAVKVALDREALRQAVARYIAAHQGGAGESSYRTALGDFDTDGREDALIYLEHPRWCEGERCLAAVFQSIPEGMRLISDFPALARPLFLSWEERFGWRSLYSASDSRGRLWDAGSLHFAGRGYVRYPRPLQAQESPPSERRGEWLEFGDASEQAIRRIPGELRFSRDFQLFRPCGGSWHFVQDATTYGLEDALDELGIEKRRLLPVIAEGAVGEHPSRCEPCQAFESSLTVFRLLAPETSALCSAPRPR